MIGVLVVDDQPMVARVQAEMVDRVDGFRTVAVVHDGNAALVRVHQGDVDLVLLDLSMPGMGGLEVCRRLHALPDAPDVIVVTAVRDMAAVHTAVRHGAVLYLVKPFTFTTLRERLMQYATFRRTATERRSVDQREIDEALAALRTPVSTTSVPKTLSPESLDAVRAALADEPAGLTAAETAERTGMARVTARRYLDHLTVSGVCLREPVYGRTGRPLLRYRLR
ncbi:MAG: response regulator [Actinomycetales bacterium]|nr:response regulator [Actinomycetales bacterium]